MMRRLTVYLLIFTVAGVGLLAQSVTRIRDSSNAAILASAVTEQTFNASTTWTSVVGTTPMWRGSSALPSAVTADRPVAPLALTTGALGTFPVASSFGGASTCFLSSAASTNSTSCQSGQSTIYDISVVNTTSTVYFLRLYNSSGAPTCSSATGFVESIPVPHNTGSGGGIVRTFPVGRNYGTGIGFCLTGGGSSTDNTNAATGVYISIGIK